MLRPLWLCLPALIGGCAPLTFSKPASIDFLAYPSVLVELAGPDGSQRQLAYLEDELREHSGFQRVTRDPLQPFSARLLVELTLGSSDAEEAGDDTFLDALLDTDDDDDDEGTTYSGSATYRLIAAEGQVVDSGGEIVSAEATYFGAAESALDLVVYHYLRAYRL